MYEHWTILKCDVHRCPGQGEWMALAPHTWHNPVKTKHFPSKEAAQAYLQTRRGGHGAAGRGGNRGPIPVIDDTTGKAYRSMNDAALKLGFNAAHIQQCVVGKREHVGGHHFSKLIED